jgi:hypothetical protein
MRGGCTPQYCAKAIGDERVWVGVDQACNIWMESRAAKQTQFYHSGLLITLSQIVDLSDTASNRAMYGCMNVVVGTNAFGSLLAQVPPKNNSKTFGLEVSTTGEYGAGQSECPI